MLKPFTSYPAIKSLLSPYTPPHLQNPTYHQLSTNQTPHLQPLQITYHPQITSFQNILHLYFKTFHPTHHPPHFFHPPQTYQPIIFY
ncbi:peptide-methionine (S)-S-oxide reductase, partial [Staphylococcus pasteuri]|uniref:peptide-methionine (S)-S-oxide reductase n=1 Tax=Staphylococcus pasteuri TaxID=45972 RepID=UPI0036F2ED2D